MEDLALKLVYLLIMIVFLVKLIKDLKRKEINTLVAGTRRLFGVQKYEKGHPGIAIIKKKNSPNLYWTGIAIDVVLIVFGVYVGYRIL